MSMCILRNASKAREHWLGTMLGVLLLFPACTSPDSGAPPVDFARQVLPVLSENCFPCHGPDTSKVEAGLSLRTFEGATSLLPSGATAVVPGNRDESALWRRINASSEPMPPPESHKSLTPEQIAMLGNWIEQGGAYARHWAYQPLARRDPPSVRDPAWMSNPVDRFVAARLERDGLAPGPQASKAVLVRRLFLDLVGMPPTVRETEDFLEDASSGAYEALVDRLLEDPRFGETLATWWLDLVRYADSVGYHGDQDRPMWLYRRWVIQALNRNMPFDAFSIWQLAGDLMPDATQEHRIAAAYNRLYSETAEGGAQDAEYIAIYRDDQVRNLSEVWLGASIGCARCHDHKYDPIPTHDFYNMAAFFADIDAPIVSNQKTNRLHWVPFIFVPQNGRQSALIRRVERRYQTLLARHPEEAGQIEILHVTRDREPPPAAAGSWQAEFLELVKKRLVLADTVPVLPTARARVVPRTVRVLPRGDWMDESGEISVPAVPSFLGSLASTPERRLTRRDLAGWLFSEENPKTARVIVNRLWGLYFGNALARNQLDLGSQGEVPTHPWLLDYLAGRFRQEWDLKAMIRLMLTSRTYRQSSLSRQDLEQKDPENRLLARQNTWRLSAERVRDQALAVSGLLKTQVGAPSVKPYQPEGHWEPLNFPKRPYLVSTGDDLYRRSVYTWVQRTFPNPLLTNFDAPNRETCLAERSLTNTPLQALTTLNSETFVEAARHWAERLLKGRGGDEARLRRAFLELLSRQPTDSEVSHLKEVLQKMRSLYQNAPDQASRLLAVGASPPDATLDPAEAAVWTHVCRVLLNLNETLVRL